MIEGTAIEITGVVAGVVSTVVWPTFMCELASVAAGPPAAAPKTPRATTDAPPVMTASNFTFLALRNLTAPHLISAIW